jgi:type VI secretion system protein VasJ
MLGKLSFNQAWKWAAVGKHPAAADYIRLESATPLLQAVADWATKGYDHITESKGNPQGNYSWRFWLRGVKRGNLIAGVVRDSSDRIGRPFPLLIMGEGRVKGWEKKWEMLPALLARFWQRAEYIGAHQYGDLAALSAEISAFVSPQAGHLKKMKQPTASLTLSPEFSACAASLQRDGKALVNLNHMPAGDMVDASIQWHAQLKGCARELPRAVFLGGTPQRTCLVVLQHPLSYADFETLWTV